MKKTLLFLFLLISPYLFIVGVNEYCRNFLPPNKSYSINNTFGIKVKPINSNVKNKKYCSWECHNWTDYCRKNHLKIKTPYIKYVDKIYFSIVILLLSTGNYVIANIIFLVILCPLFIIFMTYKIITLK